MIKHWTDSKSTASAVVLFAAILLFTYLPVHSSEENVRRKIQLSREEEVLLLLVDMPVDCGVAFERAIQPERVAKTVRELSAYTSEELEIGIRAYLGRSGSDCFEDRMGKLFVLNSYLFEVPDFVEYDNEFAGVGVKFFQVPTRGEDEFSPRHPWTVDDKGKWTLKQSAFSIGQVSSTGYHGLEAFLLLKSRYPRRASDADEK